MPCSPKRNHRSISIICFVNGGCCGTHLADPVCTSHFLQRSGIVVSISGGSVVVYTSDASLLVTSDASLLVLGTRRKAQPPMQLRQHLGCRASSHGRSSRSLPLRQPACAICSAKALHKAQHLKKPDQHSLLELLPRCIRSSDFSDLSHREHSDTGPPIIPKVA